MQRQYSFPVAAIGTTQEISQDWQIARISIDNPSGLWLYLSPVARWVPPQTIGWVVNVAPTTQRLTISYAVAPAGGLPSVATGGPIIAIVYDEATADITGLDYSLVPAIINLEAAITALRVELENTRTGNGTVAQAGYNTSVYNVPQLSAGGGVVASVGFFPAPGPGLRNYFTRITGMVRTAPEAFPPYLANSGIAAPFVARVIDGGGNTLLQCDDNEPTVLANAGAIFGPVNDAQQLNILCVVGQASAWEPFIIVEWYVAP